MKNYRKIYEAKCNIKIPKGYEIHHIDFNRENNDISNLVMLPKKLHQEYHNKLRLYETMGYEIELKLKSSIENGSMINDYIREIYLTEIKEFIDTWYECMRYVDYRNYLLGIIPYNFNLLDIEKELQ